MSGPVVKSSLVMPKIQVRDSEGKHYDLDVQGTTTIGEMKVLLATQHKFPLVGLNLILSAWILPNAAQFKNLSILPGANIFVYVTSAYEPSPDRPPSVPAFVAPTGGGTGEPANFQELVSTLRELGFEAPLCEKALQSSNYDVEQAGNMLLSGNVPSGAPSEPPRQGDEPQIFDELQGRFYELSEEDRQAVMRLVSIGGSPSAALEIFIICDRNEEQARAMLLS
jgi:hypothetical protein